MDDPMTAAPAPPVDVTATLQRLARSGPGSRPVISVYLDTRWADEHQRERVRVFLKNEIRKAAAMSIGQLDDELAWIAAEGGRLIDQEVHPDAEGAVMFVGGPDDLRELIPLAAPPGDSFTVAGTPRLRPLVAALGEAPRAAVLFVDGASARIVAITEEGPGEEIALESTDTVGQHRRGGWLLLMQSRYQRHIHVHRARHFEAVASALADLVDHYGLRAIVLAGEPRNVAVFRTHVPPRLAGRIVGEVPAARYEPSNVITGRARAVVRDHDSREVCAAVDTVLVEAEGGGRAVVGTDATLDAVNLGAVDRLYLLRTYEEEGRACASCHALQREVVCRYCGAATAAIELGEGMVVRVLAASGDVASVETHEGLARAEGVAARLRYPLP